MLTNNITVIFHLLNTCDDIVIVLFMIIVTIIVSRLFKFDFLFFIRLFPLSNRKTQIKTHELKWPDVTESY